MIATHLHFGKSWSIFEYMSSTLLQAKDLTHLYSPGKGADKVSISVEPGEVVGFIGPNGAGKTTTISMLTGLLTPQSGSLEILGQPLQQKSDFTSIYSELGYLPSDSSYYKGISAEAMIDYAIELRNGDQKALRKQAHSFASRLDLDITKKISKLSLGNKRKVGIILSIFFNPKLIIMDEPTTGLDPLVQKETLEILNEMSNQGAGVLLSSHNLAEVDQICDRVIIIKAAQVIFSDKVSAIKKLAQKRIRFEFGASATMTQIEAVTNKIGKLTDGEVIVLENHGELLSNKASEVVSLLISEGISEFTVENPSLEKMFINYYKK